MKNLSPINESEDVVTKEYVDDSVDKRLPKSGGTMEPDSEIVIPYGTTGRATSFLVCLVSIACFSIYL